MAFQGETHLLRISFTDSVGATVAPSLPTITNIEVRIINKISGEVVEKWSREAQTGFQTMTVSGNYLMLYCDKDVLDKKQVGNYDIQITVITPNANFTYGNYQIEKGELLTLISASNG